MIELKPCPFCSGSAVLVRPATPRQSCIVQCSNCGCKLDSNDPEWNSGAAWNRRAADQPSPARDRDTELREFAGFLTAYLPELHSFEVPKMLDAIAAFRAADNGPTPQPSPAHADALGEIRARDRESGALWFTGPLSFTAQAARDRRALLGIIDAAPHTPQPSTQHESLSGGNTGEPNACSGAEERGISGATGAGRLPDDNQESTGDSEERLSPVGQTKTPTPDESHRHPASPDAQPSAAPCQYCDGSGYTMIGGDEAHLQTHVPCICRAADSADHREEVVT